MPSPRVRGVARKERDAEPVCTAAEKTEAGAVVRRHLAANAAPMANADLRALKPLFVTTVARGSSDHTAFYFKPLVELKVALACASFAPRDRLALSRPVTVRRRGRDCHLQSFRSLDIVAMQRMAKEGRAMTIAFVNDEASPLARGADALFLFARGRGASVAATNSVIASLVADASRLVHCSDDDDELLAATTNSSPRSTASLRSSSASRSRRWRSRRRPKSHLSSSWGEGRHSRLRARGRCASAV
jgi:fructoselysine-6-P-deglycase FrlB-like protein